MPKRIYLPKQSNHDGIDITWTPTRQRLDIGGWFDSGVGIGPTSMTLREFFDALGITEQHCKAAWRNAVRKE